MASQEFKSFSRFPLDVKLLIWEFATELVLPRVVELNRRRRGKDSEPDDSFISPTPCHPLLRTCQLSRTVMLKKWPLSFGDNAHLPRIPFNFEMDTLYLTRDVADERSFSQRVSMEERRKVKKVALHIPTFDETIDEPGTDEWGMEFGQMLNEDFPTLDTLY